MARLSEPTAPRTDGEAAHVPVRVRMRGVRKASSEVPILTTMTFDTRGFTMMGVSPEKAVQALAQLGDQQDAGLVVSMCSMALRAHADRVASRADRLLSESAVLGKCERTRGRIRDSCRSTQTGDFVLT